MRKEMMGIGILILLALLPLVSAGVGIKWAEQSVMVDEGGKACMTYSVYNPFPVETNVIIELSEELRGIVTEQESEAKLIPANTPSTNAIPVKFCFKVPRVYQAERNCLVLGLMCKQECNEEMKVYSGKVNVQAVPPATVISGSGGSSTQMGVSAPLTIRVACSAHGRDFTIIYIALAIIAVIVIAIILVNKYRKPKSERDKDKLRKLQEEIRKEKRKK
jgi:hypothetical protein